jgi:hypothetical protein
VFHDLTHAVFKISKISFSTKTMVILSVSTTALFQLWPTVQIDKINLFIPVAVEHKD